MMGQMILVRVQRIEWAAEGIVEIELRPVAQSDLPEFTAGSHVDLRLPNGLVRSYSLTNDTRERHRYVIGVGLDASSRGGSRYLHQDLNVGARMDVSPPRNNFLLIEKAPYSIFIAGGIGVTPILSMARRLAILGRSFEVYLAAREPSRVAFSNEIRSLCGKVIVHCDSEHNGSPLAMARIIREAPPEAEIYCCGPPAMLVTFETETRLMSDRAHIERFRAGEQPTVAVEQSFQVDLVRSEKSIQVPADKTILEALLAADVDVAYSCRAGICGSCETKVLSGVPDHRDSLLSEAEKASNATMMICISRCKGERLALDL